MNRKQASSRRDHLTVTTEENKIELTEEQLDRVTGAVAGLKWTPGVTFLKWDVAAPLKI